MLKDDERAEFYRAYPPDKEMLAYIKQMRQTKYDDKIIESRAKKYFYNKWLQAYSSSVCQYPD